MKLLEKGWYVGVCYSFDEFKGLVDVYFKIKN